MLRSRHGTARTVEDDDDRMTKDKGTSHGRVAASVEIINKTFSINGRTRKVLSELRFDVHDHECLAILGPSGCGKTTLLRLIAGVDLEYEGVITVHGNVVRGPSRDRGLMFQESRLLPWLSVEHNIAFALPKGLSGNEKRRLVVDTLTLVGLYEYRKAWPSQLSGGMAKRVALARAIINCPKLLLLDEPFAALDSPTKYSLQDEIMRIHRAEHRMSTVLVTHDIDEAVYMSDRILILSPIPSHVLLQIPVSLSRPRNRASGQFQAVCSDVTKSIFELWWKSSLEPQLS